MLYFKVMLEVEGRFVQIENLEQLRQLHSFIGLYLGVTNTSLSENTNPPAQMHPANVPATQSSILPNYVPPAEDYHSNPPKTAIKGERGIDYAVKAAQTFNGRPFTLKQLADKMESLGWQTESTNKPNTVRSTIRINDAFLNFGDGTWGYRSLKPTASAPITISETNSGDAERTKT